MLEKMLTVSVKNKEQPIHWHDLLEIDLVIEGEMEVVRNNRSFSVGEGEMIVLNRDDVHSVNKKSDDLLYIELHLGMEYYNQYIPDIWMVLFYCSPEENDIISQNLKDEMKSHICNIVSLMDDHSNNPDAEKKMIYYCIDILSTLKMAFSAKKNTETEPLSEEQSDRMWKVIDYMYDNYNRKLTLNEVASQVYISGDYLSRLLKKQNGMSFEEFLSFIRAEMSVRNLLNTDMKITNIAYDCGFSAPKYYNTAFMKIYGCTPAEYRKKNKKNFMMERQKEAAKVIYDEGIEKRYFLESLEKYKILSAGADVLQEKICIDAGNIENTGVQIREIRYLKTRPKDLYSYMMQTALTEVDLPCFSPKEGIYVWKTNDTLKLMLFNFVNMGRKEYLLQINGLLKTERYIYCRERTPEIPESMNKIIYKGEAYKLDRDIMKNVYNRTFEYGEVANEQQLFMDIELNEEQIMKITLQKI